MAIKKSRNRFVGRWIIILSLLLLGATAPTQDLTVVWNRVEDQAQTRTCDAFWGDQNSKGNGNEAAEPGERIFFEIVVLNSGTDPITSLRARLEDSNAETALTNPSCDDGSLLGVPFHWENHPSSPLGLGGIASNYDGFNGAFHYDPFVIELSQEALCAEHIALTLKLDYTTSSGSCTGGCEQEYIFTLPVFALDQQFTGGGDGTLFESTVDQRWFSGATNDASVGLYWIGGSITPTFYYGRIDLEGSVLHDAMDLGIDASSTHRLPATVWNEYVEAFETYYISGSEIRYLNRSEAWGGSTSDGLLYSFAFINSLSVVVNPELPSISGSYEIGLAADTGSSVALFRVREGHWGGGYEEMFYLGGYSNIDNIEPDATRCDIAYMPGGLYYVVWEEHSTDLGPPAAPVDRLHIRAYSHTNLAGGAVHSASIPLPSTPSRIAASPTLAIDPRLHRVAVAWVEQEASGQREIRIHYYNEDLTGATPLFQSSSVPVTDAPTSYHAWEPRLTFKGTHFFLSWFEGQRGSVFTSKVRTAALMLDAASLTGREWVFQESDMSETWTSMDYLSAFCSLDTCYLLWADHRGSPTYPGSLQAGLFQPVHSQLPTNYDRTDGTPLGSTFEEIYHPSLASKGTEYLAAWWHQQEYTDGLYKKHFLDRITVSSFNADGSAAGYKDEPLYISDLEEGAYNFWPFNPTAIVNGSYYEVYWRDTASVQRQVLTMGSSPEALDTLDSPSAEVAAAAGDGTGGFLAAYIDQKGPDISRSLYLDNSAGAGSDAVRLAGGAGGDQVVSAAVAHNASLADPDIHWFAAWTQLSAMGSDLKFARLQNDPISLSAGGIQVLDAVISDINPLLRACSIAAHKDLVAVLSTRFDTMEHGQLKLHLLDPDQDTPLTPREVILVTSAYLLRNPHIQWTGTEFIATALMQTERETMVGTKPIPYNFIQFHLDYWGNPIGWPTRITTPRIQHWPPLDPGETGRFDFVSAPLSNGGVAAYTRDGSLPSGKLYSNLYTIPLGWDGDVQGCSIYNVAPTVTANGPYSVEFGQAVDLTGTVTANDWGDTITAHGWDLTVADPDNPDEPRFTDQLGATVNLTATLQLQYGMGTPGVYNIAYLAEDDHGAVGWNDTTLTITDTTPPTVYVTHPNGGETFHGGETIPVTWEGSDNFQVNHWDVHYCTTWPNCPADEDWHSIQTNVGPTDFGVPWPIPVNALTATCRIRVRGVDDSPGSNIGTDYSDGNFYIVQPTTTSYRTAVLWDSYRLCTIYDPSSTTCDCSDWRNDSDCAETQDIDTKLQELADNDKVLGAVLDLTNWRNGNSSIQALYADWDANPTNPAKANAVAAAIRAYLHDPSTGQIAKVFTNTQFIQLVGDDRQIPFYRMTDGTMQGSYSESVYPTEVAISTATTVGSALAAGYFLTDNFYSESDPENSGLDSPHDLAYQNDYAIGRLVETPDQIAEVINVFIEQDGQLNYFEPSLKTLTTGFTFVYDAALAIKDVLAERATSSVECLLENPLSEDFENECMTIAGAPTTDFYYDPAAMNDNLFGFTKHKITAVLSHANHYSFSTSPEADPASNYNYCTDPSYDAVACGAAGIDAQSSTNLRGGLVYTSGCHSGLPIPNGGLDILERDLPEAMAKKGVATYIGNTGYGWAIEHGKGLTETLLIGFTDALLDAGSIAVGKALAEAKRDYYLEEKRYDVFDEKVLHELTLFGIPNYLIVTSNTRAAEGEKLPVPAGPDHGCADGVCLDKAVKTALNAGLPDGMTQLDLNFRFANIGPYQKVEVCEDHDGDGCEKPAEDPLDIYFGEYWTLNGYASGETGDAIQPKFVYNSTLSGLEHHGVLFTGGTIDTTKTDATFTPLGAVPLATPNTPNPGAGPLPASGGFVPALRSSVSPTGGLTLRDGEGGKELNMVVHTGYCTGYDSVAKTCTEQVYQDMQFSVFYHMDPEAESTAPVVTAWDEATYAYAGAAVSIPDTGAAADAPFTIGGALVGITDINVLVNLQHTRDEDLRIELVAPDATAVVLSEANGGEEDDYGIYTAPDTCQYTVFDEGATVPITEGMAPFKGTYSPEGSFAALLGESEPISDTWTLRVTDLNPGNGTTGEIKAWKITFNERYHELDGQTATFKVQSAETDLYRVLVTYLDGGLATPQWRSADLVKNPVSGFWEGSATLLGNTQYMVQAVDTAGNIGQVVESGQDHSVAGSGGIKYGSTWEYAKIFSIARGDGDGLLDTWEDQYSACLDSNKADTDSNGIPDASDDPDYDELTCLQEYTAGTNPCVADSDGDGDNDGSEDNNGKDPLAQGDGDRLTIGLENLGGGNVLVVWPRATDTGAPGGTVCSPVGPGCFAVADNNLIDGHFRVYVSTDLRFDPADLRYGPDGDTGDGPYDLDQPDQRQYAILHASLPPEYQAAPILYFNTFNWDILTEPPLIETVLRSGSNPLAFTIYGQYFHPTASQALLCESATTCAVPVPMTESYRSTDRIQAAAPGGTTGTKYIAVQNPDGLIHIWSTPYAF